MHRLDSYSQSDSESHDCECRRFYINVSNFTGTLPALRLNGNHYTEARSNLQIILNELQEGLVLKLLLPTEPPSPSPMINNYSLCDNWTTPDVKVLNGRNRAMIPLNSIQQFNGEEPRPLLQGFKRLFSFSNSALHRVDEPLLGSNSLQVYPHQIDEVPNHPFSCRIENSSDNHCNQEDLPLPSVTIFKRNEIFMETLLPISPICGPDDVTSVQLDRLCVRNYANVLIATPPYDALITLINLMPVSA